MMIKSELQNVKLWFKLSLQSCSSLFQFLQKIFKMIISLKETREPAIPVVMAH